VTKRDNFMTMVNVCSAWDVRVINKHETRFNRHV